MRPSSWVAIGIVFLALLVAVMDYNSTGLVDWYTDGTHIAQRGGQNLVAGTGITLTGADAPADARVNITAAVTTAYRLPQGCSNSQIAQWVAASSTWDCISQAGGGSPITLDIDDDGVNESTNLSEIATTGTPNAVFSEPSANKLLINLGGNWPTADTATTATTLASDPANCGAGQAAGGITAIGTAESCLDPLVSTELDTEAELEALLTDVTNVFTNNDTLDISSNTNLTSTAPITLTGDAIGLTQNAGTDVTADLEEETHASEHATTSSDPLYIQRSAMFVQTGVVTSTSAILNIRLPTDNGGTIKDAYCTANTQPTGSTLRIDVTLNGSSIFADTSTMVNIAASTNSDTSGAPSTTTYVAGDYFMVEFDAYDSGGTSANLTCYVRVREVVFDSA